MPLEVCLGGSFLKNTATFPPHVTYENTDVCHNVTMPFDNLHSVAEGSEIHLRGGGSYS